MKVFLDLFGPRFQHGNTKLGKGGLIWAWNIPPLTTCPGASDVCSEVLPDGLPRCYAMREGFRQVNVQRRHRLNYHWTQQDYFVRRATDVIQRHRCKVIRWNDTGDWYGADYIGKAIQIVRATPNTRHYCYTRSWAVPELLPILLELARHSNFHMWFSFDRSMAIPPHIGGIALCYLAVDDDDQPPCHVDLVFRDWPRYGRPKTVLIRAAHDSFVCPYENGRDQNVTCSDCRYCWTRR